MIRTAMSGDPGLDEGPNVDADAPRAAIVRTMTTTERRHRRAATTPMIAVPTSRPNNKYGEIALAKSATWFVTGSCRATTPVAARQTPSNARRAGPPPGAMRRLSSVAAIDPGIFTVGY